MSHSVLVYREIPAGVRPSCATVIALHGASGRLDDLTPAMQALGDDVDRVIPEAARGVHDSRHWVVGYSWFGGKQLVRPEPTSFGDSLAQLEQFIHDVGERAGAGGVVRPWLIGFEQGAVMSLALAGVLPDLISGVVAICGVMPEIRDWNPLSEEPAGLPILFIADPGDPVASGRVADENVSLLRQWGANVECCEIDDARRLGPVTVEYVRAWLSGQVDTE